MSFISIVATKNYVNVVSDGLVLRKSENGELIRIQEDFQKFMKISENQFVAFGGNHGIFEKVKETIPYNPNSYDLNELSEMLFSKSSEVTPEEASIMMAVGGLDKEYKRIEFFTFSNKGNHIQHYRPNNEEVAYSFIISNYIDDEKLGEIDRMFMKLVRLHGYKKISKINKVQKDLSLIVSNMDPSVNKVTFNLSITK